MGIFLSLDDAINSVKDLENPPTDDHDEYVRLEIRERKIGKMHSYNSGETVAVVQWIQDFIESQDKWIWRKPSIALENANQNTK